eukprot:1590463-Lingulodinium_polyedra.AAC.1
MPLVREGTQDGWVVRVGVENEMWDTTVGLMLTDGLSEPTPNAAAASRPLPQCSPSRDGLNP